MVFGTSASDREERINVTRMMDYRLNRTTEQLKKDGLGALITWDAYNIRYISGAYITIPLRWIEGSWCILTNDGEYYVNSRTVRGHLTLEDEAPWLKGRLITGEMGGGKMAQTKADVEELVKTAARIMAEHNVAKGPLGLDGCTSELLFAEAFKDVDIDCVDGKNTMFEARKIKNQDEIECHRTACNIATAAHADIRDAIRPGITECELVGIGMNRLYAMGADEVQEFVCASGYRSNPLHIDFTDKPIDAGDMVIVDVNACSWLGYKTCYYRTYTCGKATDEQKEIHEKNRTMLYAGMSAVKAGNTTWDVASKWPDSPKFWGWDDWADVTGYAGGHGIGIPLHEKPFFGRDSQKNPVKLEEGMVVALETWYGPRDGKHGDRLEEDIVVTEEGYDLLTHFPIDELTECWI